MPATATAPAATTAVLDGDVARLCVDHVDTKRGHRARPAPLPSGPTPTDHDQPTGIWLGQNLRLGFHKVVFILEGQF